MLSRRGLFAGGLALLSAPAIVRATSLMPLRGEPLLPMSEPIKWSSSSQWLRLEPGDRVLFGNQILCVKSVHISGETVYVSGENEIDAVGPALPFWYC